MVATLQDWLGTFWRLMVAPTPGNFLKEARKADGKFASAVGWLVSCAIYYSALAYILVGPISFALLLAAVFLYPLAIILYTSAMNFVLRRIAYRKEYIYDKMLYLTVASLLPLQFIFINIARFLPDMVWIILANLLLLYQAGLLTVALKTTADVKYWQAFASVVLAMLVTVLVSAIVVLLIYSTVMGPVQAR